MVSQAKYDRAQAIRQATELFWARGFHATSMRTIQAAIDMRPGSIYASFGSKEGLFQEALTHYACSSRARLAACVDKAPSPLEGLRGFVIEVVIECRETAPSGMCMLVKTIAELTSEHADLLALARQLLKEMEAAFAGVLRQAQVEGEIDAAKSPEHMARYLQMQLMGLRAYARANEGDELIRAMIDDVFANLRSAPQASSSPA
ncbi:TetR/AcrR family transcriptional regulator [Oceanimonas pelagia]|uniref:TetR/AcrR family transcriptional regulator n=1 Tax=Oceanimonas pelagia TaxID=3028314 RepID=A0AA50KMU1_9GAMM|nr:TetR/AcrR family transcriptional regulator [Oceanimonas pelagia]WMC10695.1 TetR/AcrR family transcriptional regulator [Oceanimonas pelagia]